MSQPGHTGVNNRRRSEGRMRWTKPDPSQDKNVHMIYIISFLIMTIMNNYNLIFTYALFCAIFFAVMFLLNTVSSNISSFRQNSIWQIKWKMPIWNLIYYTAYHPVTPGYHGLHYMNVEENWNDQRWSHYMYKYIKKTKTVPIKVQRYKVVVFILFKWLWKNIPRKK